MIMKMKRLLIFEKIKFMFETWIINYVRWVRSTLTDATSIVAEKHCQLDPSFIFMLMMEISLLIANGTPDSLVSLLP